MFPAVSYAIPFPHPLKRKQPVTDTSRDLQNTPVFLIIRASTNTFRSGGDGESPASPNLQKMQQ